MYAPIQEILHSKSWSYRLFRIAVGFGYRRVVGAQLVGHVGEGGTPVGE